MNKIAELDAQRRKAPPPHPLPFSWPFLIRSLAVLCIPSFRILPECNRRRA